MARLTDPVSSLRGVGPAKAKMLQALNIFTTRYICKYIYSFSI